MILKKIKASFIILLLIITIGGFLRFYKLDWGEGLFTHPDEYFITISVNQLSFPLQMHPHFFNYGTVIIYLNYFTKVILQKFNLNPFLIGRFYSALFSTLTILIVYQISKLILNKKWALTSAFLVAITPGLIQQAHFATPDSILTFFICTSLLFLLYFIKQGKLKYLLLVSIFLGLGLGTKIIAALFLPMIFLVILFKLWRAPIKLILFSLIALLTCIVIFFITSPFVFLDYTNWYQSLNYENALARGDILVSYTRQFINTYPVLFQLEKILPYALGIPLLIFSILGIIFIAIKLLGNFNLELFIVSLTFLCLFVPNTLLFTKWTRFIAPTFPFFAMFASFFLQQINNRSRFSVSIVSLILFVSTAVWSLSFFSIYLNHDVRIKSNQWITLQLPINSSYLVEGGNMVDLPLSGNKRISLDFYRFEEDPSVRQKIIEALLQTDYFIIQSRRIFLNHQRLPTLYPLTTRFYNALFNGQLGFEEIKQFHSYPSLPFPGSGVEFPDELAEETWSVFDHPVIRIFQNKFRLTEETYARFLE